MRQVQTYHLGQAPRVYSFDRKVYDRTVRARQGVVEPLKERRPFNPPKQAAPLGLGGAFGGPAHAISPAIPNFGSLFTSPYQAVQGNLGQTYGGTLRDTGGSGPVLTVAVAPTGPTIPIWIKATSSGTPWNYSVYYDGVGTTPVATGSSSGGTIALPGAGGGTINIAAGAATINNIWKATWAGWADQTVNAKHYTQATPASQPIIGIGLGAMCSAIFDGVDDGLLSSLVLALPSSANVDRYAVWRWVTNPAAIMGVFCAQGFNFLVDNGGAANNVRMYNGGQIGTTMTAGTWYRTVEHHVGTSSSSLRVGATTVTGDVGNNGATQMYMGRRSDGFYGNVEMLLAVTAPSQSYTSADAALAALPGFGVVNR